MQIEYIENDKNKGIKYDWKKVKKEYKKLGCPESVYNPCKLPLGIASIMQILSERSTGKTTNILLMGMILNKLYGTIIQYIRINESMIMNKTIGELFKTIREFHYVEKLTDGKYNDVTYNARKWYYCKVDESGEIVERDPKHFMFCLSVDKNEMYKSSYNAPIGDWIIIDEFIGKRYIMNEFVYLMDLLKTIIRDRLCVTILMLANTIDKHSEYFNEFEIYDEIQRMEVGNSEIFTTELGTNIYVELIADKKESALKTMVNKLYFGFKNPKMASITGGGWATNDYPHFEKDGWRKILGGIYIEYHDRLLALDIGEYEGKGFYIHVHNAYRTYDDSIIYSLNEPKDLRYRYYMGMGDGLDKLIVRMVQNHRIRFQNNAVGTMFFNHYNQKGAKKAGY